MRSPWLSFSLSLGFMLLVVAASMSLSFQTSAAAKKPKREVTIVSTAWELTGALKGSLKKVGKMRGDLGLQLFFGPLELVDGTGQLVIALEAGHFLIQDLGSGAIIQGQFIDNGKGKLLLLPDLDELRSVLASTFEDVFDFTNLDITELSIDKVVMNAKAKASGEEDSMKLKFSSKFTATANVNGLVGPLKGSFIFKTAGAPVVVEPASQDS